MLAFLPAQRQHQPPHLIAPDQPVPRLLLIEQGGDRREAEQAMHLGGGLDALVQQVQPNRHDQTQANRRHQRQRHQLLRPAANGIVGRQRRRLDAQESRRIGFQGQKINALVQRVQLRADPFEVLGQRQTLVVVADEPTGAFLDLLLFRRQGLFDLAGLAHRRAPLLQQLVAGIRGQRLGVDPDIFVQVLQLAFGHGAQWMLRRQPADFVEQVAPFGPQVILEAVEAAVVGHDLRDRRIQRRFRCLPLAGIVGVERRLHFGQLAPGRVQRDAALLQQALVGIVLGAFVEGGHAQLLPQFAAAPGFFPGLPGEFGLAGPQVHQPLVAAVQVLFLDGLQEDAQIGIERFRQSLGLTTPERDADQVGILDSAATDRAHQPQHRLVLADSVWLPHRPVIAQLAQGFQRDVVPVEVADLLLNVLQVLGVGLEFQFLVALEHLGEAGRDVDRRVHFVAIARRLVPGQRRSHRRHRQHDGQRQPLALAQADQRHERAAGR